MMFQKKKIIAKLAGLNLGLEFPKKNNFHQLITVLLRRESRAKHIQSLLGKAL
jgi:hypothetical protein